MNQDDRYRLLRGSAEPPSELRTLRAGPVTALLDGVDLRYVRIGHVELVRRVYAAVRDRDWDTVPGAISDLQVEERDDGFEVRFGVRHRRAGIDFSWVGTITGDASGRITYSFDGRAEGDLQYNRIGICLHHPWRETAGQPFRARTPDGEIEGVFPDLIGQQRFEGGVYHPLFPSFDRLNVELADGGSLALTFEGDLWETEDHRNWTDANFKTYSTPMALGFPHELTAGQALAQTLTILPSGVSAGGDEARPVRIAVGSPTGARVPALGLGADSDRHVASEREASLVAALAPAHLRVEVRLDRDDWSDALAVAQALARRIGSHLEVSVHLWSEHAGALPELAEALAAGPPVDRVLVILAGGQTSTPEETTPGELVGLVRGGLATSLPGTPFYGGTEMYFTELNRTRPRHASWDGLCFSITPQIHAFTDVDIVENLDAQGENLRSARAIAQGKPVAVTPITIRRRVNFHVADPGAVPEVAPGELPDSVEVRQPSLLGAAWTAGSLKYVSEGEAASVTYYETTGWRGVVERDEGTPLPQRFFSRPGEAFPLYHPLADVAGWVGAEVLACPSSEPLAAVCLAVRTQDGTTRLLLANLTAQPREVVVAPLTGSLALRRLSEETAGAAAADPATFRSSGQAAEASGEIALALAPYEVVRIDPA